MLSVSSILQKKILRRSWSM
ncbi:hypothetical protein Q3G72_022209 [Acer saccharum]|nr:hypothetical protein Q3G72_022209 [Acer saccharum]